MPVGGRGQEVSADWKCPTDGFQVTTIRRALERGANESLRWVTGRRGWERCESGRSNRVKTEPETRSPARGEPRASLDAASSLRPIQGEGRGPSPPFGAAWFRGQILGLPSKGLRESGGLLFFRPVTFAWPGGATGCRRGRSIDPNRITNTNDAVVENLRPQAAVLGHARLAREMKQEPRRVRSRASAPSISCPIVWILGVFQRAIHALGGRIALVLNPSGEASPGPAILLAKINEIHRNRWRLAPEVALHTTDATCRPSTNSAPCIRCWRRSMHDRDCGLCRCVFAAANAMDVCR